MSRIASQISLDISPIRLRLGLTQVDISKRTGLSRGTVSSADKGRPVEDRSLLSILHCLSEEASRQDRSEVINHLETIMISFKLPYPRVKQKSVPLSDFVANFVLDIDRAIDTGKISQIPSEKLQYYAKQLSEISKRIFDLIAYKNEIKLRSVEEFNTETKRYLSDPDR